MPLSYCLYCDTPTLLDQAKHIAAQLHCELVTSLADTAEKIWIFYYDKSGLSLKPKDAEKRQHALRIDFFDAALQRRCKQARTTNEPLLRVLQLQRNYPVRIIDATAGLAHDAYLIASYGAQVTMLERHPALAALLQDGLKRADNDPIAQHLALINTDAYSYLEQLSTDDRPDYVYLDPMFPERKKSALGKIHLRWLQDLVGHDEDADRLLSLACQRALKRVVVKRPYYAPPLAEKQPDTQYLGEAIRYDIYECN